LSQLDKPSDFDYKPGDDYIVEVPAPLKIVDPEYGDVDGDGNKTITAAWTVARLCNLDKISGKSLFT
jgi:hypothetical protein